MKYETKEILSEVRKINISTLVVLVVGYF